MLFIGTEKDKGIVHQNFSGVIGVSIFNFWKKKKEKKAESEVSPKKPENVRYDGEPAVSDNTSGADLRIIYDEILSKGNGAELCDSEIVYKSVGLHLTCAVQRISGNNRYSAEMLFIMTHEFFDEPLCEYTAGIGDSKEEALRHGAEQFAAVVLLPILAAFSCTGEHHIYTELDGKKHTFRRACTEMVYSMGAENPNTKNLWDIIQDDIPNYLGAKKAYWIKLYACCFDGEANCEARINGAVFTELTQKLEEYVMTWQNLQEFHSEKAFFLILREDDCEPDGLDSAEVIDIAAKSAELLSHVVDEKTEDEVLAKIYHLCGKDDNLAWEIRYFLPEIYTFIQLDLVQCDGFQLNRKDEKLSLKKSQLKSYGYIEQGVLKFMRETNPDKDTSLRIMRLSATLGCVAKALEKGSKLEDLRFVETAYIAPDDYKVR